MWFRTVLDRLSRDWRERLLHVLIESATVPDHAVKRGRQTIHLRELSYQELEEISSNSSVPDWVRPDLDLLIAVGRFWGADAVKRFRFAEVPEPTNRPGWTACCISSGTEGLAEAVSPRRHVACCSTAAYLGMLSSVFLSGEARMRVKSMRLRNLFICTAVVTAALCSASPSWAQPEARFGVWDNSTNPNNVMTYEAYEKGGSKLTVSNPSDHSKDWSYVTVLRRQVSSRGGSAGLRDSGRIDQPEEHPNL
jgi:hypothetical protein